MTYANTSDSFTSFRQEFHPPKPPRAGLVKNEGEVIQMTYIDGLELWTAGTVAAPAAQPVLPMIVKAMESDKRLWAIRETDVVHAHEFCDFGKTLETGVIKHTNLTGGAPAYCAGELLFVDDATIVVNGCSGRYGPTSEAEMVAAAKSFRDSGYNVWTQGFDEEVGRPVPFFTLDPVWVG
ncbi:hypothetical protein QA648_27745 (plasmid) [Rhizobium sp. CB3171]|uniref:hypothetical protein n=1 Tax=Rhizobium sp. CB3171 TaxID=3039157 RepID=UPI0024B04697|nr:hypothetical protein [Rhizobium sp. CB3171]WFU04572.1 hypothetical protein QA648_27745 [Rhizobium sp. CB3171]